ncbi:MAG: beta-galactosidase trimerization domain-containing protein [Phocaeicola sp.]|nr:beta-galactosidase trimerization domain-containing protein [Phocaeicola sp.]
MKKVKLLFVMLFIMLTASLNANVPLIGGQVIIEPGQSDAEIEHWFKIMHDNGMKVTRIRMFEEYMHVGDRWDFTLFDKAFKAAEKYDIKVFATLFPSTPNNSIGGFKFPLDDAHERQVVTYIEKTVNHYKNFKCLLGWVLMNEPGMGGELPKTDYTKRKFEEWKKQQTEPAYQSKGYTKLVNFDEERFLVDYTTWYLGWLANEIKKYDSNHEMHVNNHQIYDNVAEYDFPAWRPYLTSLGASAHASWHFGYFKRQQYPMAMFANCSIIRSGAGELPFWITELQGGNNTYSGYRPFCPTAEEITQWMWTSIASGAQGIIFWSLNPRSIGEESGEWALLNFQNMPSDRFEAASKVALFMDKNRKIFEDIRPFEADVDILYIRESLWTERKIQYGDLDDSTYEGRHKGGVMKSVLAFYEMLLENGVNASIAEINEYDWNKKDYKGKTLIIPNQITLPSSQWEHLCQFVKKGGKLIVEGLTSFYDENMLCLFQTGFPLQDVFGGSLQETKCIPGDFTMQFGSDKVNTHLWKGYIYNQKGKIIANEGNKITATRHQFGNGEVVWIPSLVGLGGRRIGNYHPLSNFILKEIQELSNHRFTRNYPGVYMQSFNSGKNNYSLVINKSGAQKNVELKAPASKLIYSDKDGHLSRTMLTIHPEECMIIQWK